MVDAFNQRVHVLRQRGDAAQAEGKHRTPRAAGLGSRSAWMASTRTSSTGEVIDVKAKVKVSARELFPALMDEMDREVHSEKMVEIHWKGVARS